MAKKKKKPLLKMYCSECSRINYYTSKTKNVEGKLELKKYCKWCKKSTLHSEKKKKKK